MYILLPSFNKNFNFFQVILTLKALSNIGLMFGKENVLENCYKNPQIRLEARLAAIQAYRRVSCDTPVSITR